MLRGIVHDADRMDQIVRLLVDAARVVAGSLEIFPEQTDLSELTLSVAEAQSRDPDHPPIRWTGEAGPFLVDPARMRTSILAFVEALVWWGDRGDVLVQARRDGEGLHVWASRPCGEVTPEDAEAMFAARRPGSGSGSKIGLWVSRQVAEAQGGRAWAIVEDGELAFHLWVPLPS
jgi:signal transduction histidine kinase